MSMEVANEILNQLGGRKFMVMTGAKNFVGDKDALQFSLPSRFAAGGINKVKIVLTPADVYHVTFYKLRGVKLTLISSQEGVYAEDLKAVFTKTTGLDVSL